MKQIILAQTQSYFSMMNSKFIISLLLLLINGLAFSQDENSEKIIKKLLDTKEIVWDDFNQDGVFKAKNKKTGKWGMYQYLFEGKRPKTLVRMKYDSLGFYSFSSSYTIVKNKNKYGVILSPWNDEVKARSSVKCIYQKINYVESGYGMLAAKGNDLWGYIDHKSGDTLIPFVHHTFSDLPTPNRAFFKNPMKNYPAELLKIINDPESITEIDLSGLKLSYLPEEIGLCVNAKSANLQNNNLSELPGSFFNLIQLETLFLGGNPNMTDFTADFAKLKNLKILHVNTTRSGGGFIQTNSNLTFSPELARLVKLEELAIGSNFNSNGDIPEFIYQLPNLKLLFLRGNLGRPYNNIAFEKLKCRDSLTRLYIEVLESFDNWNSSMKYFSNLRSVHIKTYNNKTTPTGIYDLKKLDVIKINYYATTRNSGGYHEGLYVLEILSKWDEDVVSPEKRKEAITKWETFIKSLEE